MMRPLGLSDTIFYNLGDAYITGMAILAGQCDLAILVAETEGVVKALPGLAERQMRLGFWSFARPAGPIDLAGHLAIIRDRTITEIAQVEPLLDRLRRSPIRNDGPPWRILVLNPAESGAAKGATPLCALFVQARHGLADATRWFQIFGGMDRRDPSPAHIALAARIPTFAMTEVADEVAVHDEGLSILQVQRRGMSRDGDASERLAMIAASAVGDPGLFPHAQPLRGNVGRTRFILRRGAANGVGNHIKMVTVKTHGQGGRRRLRIPGLARAQELPLSQWLVALAPRWLARRLMRVWYANFDAVATLVPLPRRLHLGGRAVISVFGVPPLWGPVPLVLFAIADGGQYHVVIIPGRGFKARREVLTEHIRRLLNPDAPLDAPARAVEPRRVTANAAPVPVAFAKR
jgi:hypothetical protein